MNKPVSRTISAGCSPLSRSAESRSSGFEFVRRHSAAGLRALAWTTPGSFSCSVGSEGRSSRDSLRGIVVTPDSIPQFTIPRLAVEDPNKTAWDSTEELTRTPYTHTPLSSSSSSSSSAYSLSPAPQRKAHRCVSDPDTLKKASLRRESSIPCPLMEGEHYHDPTTKAALSLPHLPKVTTPYGFITLSQSPQMANEEELFFQMRMKDNTTLRNPIQETRQNSSGRTLPVHVYANIPKKQSPDRGNNVWETKGHSGSSPPAATQTPASRPKRSLWGVLRKHLTSQKGSRWDGSI